MKLTCGDCIYFGVSTRGCFRISYCKLAAEKGFNADICSTLPPCKNFKPTRHSKISEEITEEVISLLLGSVITEGQGNRIIETVKEAIKDA